MNILFDKEKLNSLLDSFYVITGVKCGIYDIDYKEVFFSKKRSDFCAAIQGTNYGLQRCFDCDAKALRYVKQYKEAYIYRCHAGLLEAAIPIVESEEVIAYMSFGQILDDQPYDIQWRITQEKCSWYKDTDKLKEYFHSLTRLSEKQIKAYIDIASACTSYIWLKRVIRTIQQTDSQKLISYINAHFDKSITLDDIAKALCVSKTKLCLIAQKEFGSTVGKLLLKKRLETAKEYLESTTLCISEISNKVGISDYNYFAKIFRNNLGVSPTQYRNMYKIKLTE